MSTHRQLTLTGGLRVPGHTIILETTTNWRGQRREVARCSCSWRVIGDNKIIDAEVRALVHLSAMNTMRREERDDG